MRILLIIALTLVGCGNDTPTETTTERLASPVLTFTWGGTYQVSQQLPTMYGIAMDGFIYGDCPLCERLTFYIPGGNGEPGPPVPAAPFNPSDVLTMNNPIIDAGRPYLYWARVFVKTGGVWTITYWEPTWQFTNASVQ